MGCEDDSTWVLLTGVKHSAEICHGNKQMFQHQSAIMDSKMSCQDGLTVNLTHTCAVH